MPTTTWETWRDALDLSHRRPPDLYQKEDAIEGAPHAPALRLAWKMGLDAVFCVNGTPTVGFVVWDSYSPESVEELHNVFWNQGLLAMLVVISGTDLRAFSMTIREAPIDTTATGKKNTDPRLVYHLELLSQALAIQALIRKVESGQIFRDKVEHFPLKQRIDQVLLDNLEETVGKLDKAGLPLVNAQALLMQTMLIAYLEDRGILSQNYFRDATENQSSSLEEVLSRGTNGELHPLKNIFKQLRHDLNGGIFEAPCVFGEDSKIAPEITPDHCSLLLLFRKGCQDIKRRQFRLISYDFRYIPVALISAVYNSFLDVNPNKKRKEGAYYTPLHLADLVVGQVWWELSDKQRISGHFLDPACGSGVFLVRLFERLIEYQDAKGISTKWDDLVETASRLHGVDINSTAVKLAAVSLYIAMLEHMEPPDIQNLMARGHMLPQLLGESLLSSSFFMMEDGRYYDVIIGNPPWSSRREDKTGALAWAKKRHLPGKELAWAFTWKCGEKLSNNGYCALLLPAPGFLHNLKSARDRVLFFSEHKVCRVINFSDVRHLLFEGGKHPAALFLFKAVGTAPENYEFEYWVPKADLFAIRKRALTLSHSDNKRMTIREIQRDPACFTKRLWSRSRDDRLLQYLESFDRLDSFIDGYGSLSRKQQADKYGWVIGQGFTAVNEKRIDDPNYDIHALEELKNYPFVNAQELRPVALTKINNPPFPSAIVNRKRFVRGFKGPHVLINQSVVKKRVVASFTYQDLAFFDSIQSLIFPPTEISKAKILTAVINSRLASWFYFHIASAWAPRQDTVRLNELLALPFPTSDDLAESKKMQGAAARLESLVDKAIEAMSPKNGLPDAFKVFESPQLLLDEVDNAVYELYGLSQVERLLVDDFFDHIIPASQPSLKSSLPLVQPCIHKERQQYVEVLKKTLAGWFPHASVHVKSPARSQELVILHLRLGTAEEETEYHEDITDLSTVLEKLWHRIPEELGGNFYKIPNVRLFLDGDLYLIKPTYRRYWLASSALEDADEIVADLHQALAKERGRQLS